MNGFGRGGGDFGTGVRLPEWRLERACGPARLFRGELKSNFAQPFEPCQISCQNG